MEETSVLIIGAGPAGLAMAGRLRQRNIPFLLIEKSDKIASAWHGHYDRLHLHTVKEKSHLPGLDFPADYPQYVPRQLLCDYFDRYAETFAIRPLFGEEVTEVRRQPDGRWGVRSATGRQWLARHVVVATGVNRVPFRPVFPGEELFHGQIVHSRTYKNADPYRGKRVLVVGMGNTGAEIALDLAENGASSFISVRQAVNIVPRDFLGRPTQKTALLLARLPIWLGDWIGRQVQRLTMGDLPRYGLPVADVAPVKQLRETGKTPIVDIGAAQAIREGRIKVLPGIERFDESGVWFVNGEHQNFDAVILATGYRAQIEDFVDGGSAMTDPQGIPERIIGLGANEGLHFLGFDNYTAGGILGVINRDSERIADEILHSQKVATNTEPA